MNGSNIRIAVSGASGRMGRELIKYFLSSNINFQSVVLTGALTREDSQFIGYDLGKIIGIESVGIIVNHSIEAIRNDFDILVDFSCSQSTLKYVDVCKLYKKNMVIGTTGFTEKELLIIRSAANHIGIVFSPNFSVMINLMLKLLQRSAIFLKNCLDIEVIEMHHRNKQDIPSGTALRMRESVISGLSVFKNNSDDISKCFSERTKANCDIKISSIRAGGTIGEHSVFFVDTNERLELTHRAFNREIFVNGAICSVVWLGKVKIGLFDMMDVLGLDDF